MTNELAPSGAPPHSRRVWADHTHLYLEITSTDPAKPPYIMKFAKDAQGFRQALDLISSAFIATQPAPGHHKIVSREPTRVGINNFSASQRERAHEVLKKMGLI